MENDKVIPIRKWIYKRRQKRKRIRLVIVICIIAAVIAWTIISTSCKQGNKALKDNVLQEVLSQNQIERTALQAYTKEDFKLDKLREEIVKYVKGFKGTYGVGFITLSDNAEFGINDLEEFEAASTIKVPLNLYLFKKFEDGTSNPDGVMPYLKEDYEKGTGKLRYEKIGGKYSLRELSKLSIVYSDNVAANILLRYLGKHNLKEFMRKTGGRVVVDGKNVTCPRDMALYMKQIYEFSKKNQILGNELVGYLENTEYNKRLPALIPANVKVAHKVGNQVGSIHDVGIIYARQHYVLSVMSKDADESEAYEVIANISKMVYDFIEKISFY